jgi:hypothetical protein
MYGSPTWNFRRARVIAPSAHVVLFLLTWLLGSIQAEPLLDGPARLPCYLLFFGDFPFSAVAAGVVFSSSQNAPYAIAGLGILGTLWWYVLGETIETWRRR